MTATLTANDLIGHLRRQLGGEGIKETVERYVREGTSKAGKRPEEVFTRECICPALRNFFYHEIRSKLDLRDSEIGEGLGTEGFTNCEGFGFTPSANRKHLFRKTDIVQTAPPREWLRSSQLRFPSYQPCPDFAIRSPLPIRLIGESKYFASGTANAAVKELYDAARQAVFYLGAFRDTYDAALLVIADASSDSAFVEALELLRPELLDRFGPDTGVYLLVVKVH